MRDIKFRAWDSEEKRMLGPTSIYELGADDFGPSIGGKYLNFKDYPDGKIPLMQYTGLKDNNGKEIYEGDITRETRNDAKTYIIEYSDYRAAFVKRSTKHQAGSYPIEQNPDFVEVIGNIYENKDLL